MKRKLLVWAMVCPTLLFAQSSVTFWDFNSSVNDATGSTGTDLPASGIGTLTLIGNATQTFASGNSNDANNTDNSAYNTSGYPTQSTASQTAGIEMDFDATGKNNLVIEFWQRLSNTAANTWVLQYTSDYTGVSTGNTVVWTDATTFTFTPAPSGTGDTWHLRSHDFSAITALNNNATVGFRIVSAFDPNAGQYLAARSTSNYSTSGTSRFDLIKISEAASNVSIASTSNFSVVEENAGSLTIPITVANANSDQVVVTLELASYNNATEDIDFTWTKTLTIPAGTNGISTLPVIIIDDAEAEKAERIIAKIATCVNGTIHPSNNYSIIYIKDNDAIAPIGTNELNLDLLSSFSNGAVGSNSAEIVSFDSSNDRLYIANSIGSALDIVDFADPSNPNLIASIPVTTYGNINSVTTHNGIIAMAIENTDAQLDGSVVFLDQDGVFISQVTAGAMPDMITFNKDYTKILVANEGEPNADYSVDPVGSVTIVDLTPGYASLTNANVTHLLFDQYNGQEATLRAEGIRIFSSSASVAQDLEPEYITVSDDNTKAFVSIQENNALLVIDLTNNTIESLAALGYSDYNTGSGNAMDASDQSGEILITSDLPIKGAYMPDAICYATIGGQGYVFSANEGDSREFGSVVDAHRLSSSALVLDSTIFTDQHILKNSKMLGRLNALEYSGDTDNDGDLDEIHVMGGRSFSIWNAQTQELVFDSKDLLEQITSTSSISGAFFNASNSTGSATSKNRSDDKGPEPEGVATATIDGDQYLFVSMERVGGVMIFNVNNPTMPVYVGYANNRTLTGSGPDLGAEGIIFIPADQSPNGQNLVILANEVSSTLSVFGLNSCLDLSEASISSSTTILCEGDSTELLITGAANVNYQWLLNNQEIADENGTSIYAEVAGEYAISVVNNTYGCADTSDIISIDVNAFPIIVAGADITICQGESVTLIGTGAANLSWNNAILNGVSFIPNATSVYVLTGVDNNSCSGADSLTLTVNALPIIDAGVDQTICQGENVTLTATGGTQYLWNNSVLNDVAFIPTVSMDYVVAGTDQNACTAEDTVNIQVNEIPFVDLGGDSSVCAGQFPITLTATSNGNFFEWNDNSTAATLTVTQAGTYSVEATLEGCSSVEMVVVTEVNCAGLDEFAIEFTMLPNPATNQLWFNLNTTGSTTIQLYAVSGQLVQEWTINENQALFSLEGIESGSYLVHLKNQETSSVARLVVEK